VASLLPARIPRGEKLGRIRYQLLTAAAGTIAFARASDATIAILIVHEFHTTRTDDALHRSNAADLDRFTRRLTAGTISQVREGKLEGPIPISAGSAPPVYLYVGKVSRNLRPPVI
jgi:hypothetical protein